MEELVEGLGEDLGTKGQEGPTGGDDTTGGDYHFQ